MGKFNKKSEGTKKRSFEGGIVYDRKNEDAWINMLFGCMLSPQFYESSETQTDRFIALTQAMLKEYGPAFVMKAAHYSRNVMGMRSISALAAALVNAERCEGKRLFYAHYFRRPDDVAEVFAAVEMLGGKPSHGLMRGACDYLCRLDAYRLGKYKLEGKSYNIYDLVNLTHAHSGAIELLKKGTLPVPETWETRLSACRNEDQKKEAWMDLVASGKLGYLALIRNVRNICKSVKDEAWISESLFPRLVDRDAISRSMVFPYTIYTAWRMLNDELYKGDASGTLMRGFEKTLSEAFLSAAGNIPKFSGSTLSVVDCSCSMTISISPKSRVSYKDISAVYASLFSKRYSSNEISGADDMTIVFGSEARKFTASSGDSIFQTIHKLGNSQVGGSTFIDKIYPLVTRHFDRIFLFSDMQVADPASWCLSSGSRGWETRNGLSGDCKTFQKWFSEYTRAYGKCHVYSFDLANAEGQVLRTDGPISYMTGLNDKVFTFVSLIESGRSLVDEIKAYDYLQVQGGKEDAEV